MRPPSMFLFAFLTTGGLLAAAGCDSSEPRPANAVLQNRTDGPMLYAVIHEGLEGGPVVPFEIDLTDPPQDLIAAGDTAVLGPCTLPGPYEDQKLRLWDVVPAEDGSTATAAQTVGWSDGDLFGNLVDELRENDCRIVVDSLGPSFAESIVQP